MMYDIALVQVVLVNMFILTVLEIELTPGIIYHRTVSLEVDSIGWGVCPAHNGLHICEDA